MKTIINRMAITGFFYGPNFKSRTEIEFYSDETSAIVEATYYYRDNITAEFV